MQIYLQIQTMMILNTIVIILNVIWLSIFLGAYRALQKEGLIKKKRNGGAE